MANDKYGYPKDGFFVVHRRFVTLKGKPWGDLLDGPVTGEEQVLDVIMESFKDDGYLPGRDDLRVYFLEVGKPLEDCTDWAINTIREIVEDEEESA